MSATTPELPRVRRGSRFYGMLCAAVICLGFGVAYTPLSADQRTVLPPNLDKLADFVSIYFYGAAWIVAAVLLMWLATNRRRWIFAIVCTGLPPFIWSMAYVVGFFQNWDRSFLGAILYLGLAGMFVAAGTARPSQGWRLNARSRPRV